MGAKPQYLRAKSPAFPIRTAIPKYTKPGHTLGYTVADRGKENEGRGTSKESYLAYLGEDLSPELIEEINFFSAGFRPLQNTRHQVDLAISLWLCKTDSVISTNLRNFTMFSFFEENLSPGIEVTGLIILC